MTKKQKMKRLNFLFLTTLLLACATVFAQNKKGSYEVKVKVNGYTYPHALVAYYFGDKQYVVDTLHRNSEGYYVLKADSIMRGGIYLFAMVKEKRDPKTPQKLGFEALNYFEFLMDPKDNQQFTLETDSTDLVKKMKVKGSKQNEIFYKDIVFISEQRQKAEAIQAKLKDAKDKSEEKKALEAQMKTLDTEVKTARQKIMDENKGMLYTAILKASTEVEIPEPPRDENGKITDSTFQYKFFKKHYWDNIDIADDRLLRTPLYQGKVMYYLDKMVIQSPDSLIKECRMLFDAAKPNKEVFKYMVVTLLNKYANSKIMGHDGVYAYIATTYYCYPAPNIKPIALEWTDSTQCAKICERGEKIWNIRLGIPAPPVTVQSYYDKWESLYDIKADYTVLYIWDYDCGHCKKVTPKIVQVAKAYQNAKKKVQFYTIESNGTREIWKGKVKEYGLDLPNVINTADPTRASGFDKKYDILSTPRILVFDKDKKIIAKHISAKQLDELLNHFANEQEGPLVIKEEDEEHKEGEEDKHE